MTGVLSPKKTQKQVTFSGNTTSGGPNNNNNNSNTGDYGSMNGMETIYETLAEQNIETLHTQDIAVTKPKKFKLCSIF